MDKQFNRETRYVVFKLTDMQNALSPLENGLIYDALVKINHYRTNRGKSHLTCVVVEEDWPEYEPTWRAIEARMDIANGDDNG